MSTLHAKARGFAERSTHRVTGLDGGFSGRLIEAPEAERGRIACELHDDLNERLALLAIELERLAEGLSPGRQSLRSRLLELRARAEEVSVDLHRLSHQLLASPGCGRSRSARMTRIRLVLADDHTLLLEAFAKLLEPEFDVVGTCADGRALLEAAERLKPDVIVLDIGMPMLNGLDAGERLLQLLPGVKLVYLTANPDPALAAEALRLGASAYLLKTSEASELVTAIREAHSGRSYVTPLVAEWMARAFIRNGGKSRRSARLTVRQREVLQLLAEGRLMKEIAAILKITPRTVAFHKYAMMDELQIKTNAELIQYAIKSASVSA